MSTHEYDLIANAYVSLLRIPLQSPRRHALQSTLIALREELQLIEAKDAEIIQTSFEGVAAKLENQEPLGKALERIVFDNIWALYAR